MTQLKLSKPEICKNFLKVTYAHFAKKKITDSGSIKWYNIKSTEFGIHTRMVDKKLYMVVAIAGSNDLADWILNFFLGTWRGFKFAGWMESKRVFKAIKKHQEGSTNVPVILTGHSKSGATLPPLEMMLRKAGIPIDSIYSFEPATSVLRPYRIEKMTMFIDPDDLIPKIGKPFLRHPICEVIKHPGGKSGNDHSLSNWDGIL